jgi:hypothetical protein
MPTVASRKRSRQPQTFRITFQIAAEVYSVAPLTPHPETAVKAYRFRKHTGDGEVYDVRLTPEGYVECDCRGFQRWGHCKHVRTLTVAGMLPAVESPAPVATVA